MSKTITGNQLLDLIAEGMKDETDLVGTIAIGEQKESTLKLLFKTTFRKP